MCRAFHRIVNDGEKTYCTFRSEQVDPTIHKDRVSQKYSLTGGFLKIVRQKGAVRNDRSWKFYSQECVERRNRSFGMVGLTLLPARMSKTKRPTVCVLARWGRTLSGVYPDSLSNCKCMVSGAALNASIHLSILCKQFAESSTCFDGCGDDTVRASSRLSL
jgi:hypothetical protein